MKQFLAAFLLFSSCFVAEAENVFPVDHVREDLLTEALSSLQAYAEDIPNSDTIIIVDYSLHSAKKRMFIVNLNAGTVAKYRVTHGRGSDADHDGMLDSFSHVPGSNASPRGAHITGEQYVGKHGTSIRMDGLELENASARNRAIVIHAASYAEPTMINKHGKLGRSQGCLALSAQDLDTVLKQVPAGTLVYISK